MKLHENIGPLLASIRGGLYAQEQGLHPGCGKPPPPLPFVTISRQAGAGGRTFAAHLVDRLNEVDPGERPWAAWDRELVERIAAEQHIPEALIERLESYHGTTFAGMLAAVFDPAGASSLDENQLFRRVAQTIRGLARAGRAVIVGRGGVYATRGLPGGVHVRLIAPLEKRIAHMADIRNISQRDAAAEVRRLDQDRETFHRRFGGEKALLPEVFTIGLNTSQVPEDELVECVLPLVRRPAGPPLLTHRKREMATATAGEPADVHA